MGHHPEEKDLSLIFFSSIFLQPFGFSCFNENKFCTQFPQEINVWTSILRSHIVSSLFLEENLWGNINFEMLQTIIETLEIRGNNPKEIEDIKIDF